jgi:hypothetical protein
MLQETAHGPLLKAPCYYWPIPNATQKSWKAYRWPLARPIVFLTTNRRTYHEGKLPGGFVHVHDKEEYYGSITVSRKIFMGWVQ